MKYEQQFLKFLGKGMIIVTDHHFDESVSRSTLPTLDNRVFTLRVVINIARVTERKARIVQQKYLHNGIITEN